MLHPFPLSLKEGKINQCCVISPCFCWRQLCHPVWVVSAAQFLLSQRGHGESFLCRCVIDFRDQMGSHSLGLHICSSSEREKRFQAFPPRIWELSESLQQRQCSQGGEAKTRTKNGASPGQPPGAETRPVHPKKCYYSTWTLKTKCLIISDAE